MTRIILHLIPAQPGLKVDATASALAAEVAGATHLDLSQHFRGDVGQLARDADAALSAALDAVAAAPSPVLVTSAALPDALGPVAFGLQARLAAELNAGLVLVMSSQDSALEAVARAEAARAGATVAGVRLVSGGWGDTSAYVSTDDDVSSLLDALAPGVTVMLGNVGPELVAGLTIALASGQFPKPAGVHLAVAVPEDLKALWQRFAAEVPLTGAALTPLGFQRALLRDARAMNQHIVLPEGTEPRIIKAAAEVLQLGGARLTLLGNPVEVTRVASDLGVDISAATILDPTTDPLRERFADEYAELRAAKGVTREQAYERVADVSYFGTMLVRAGLADGMVSGAVNTTAHTIRPAFEVIRTKPGVKVVSSVFFMCLPDRVLVMGDCAVNPNPNAEQLADIAVASARTAQQFGIAPRVGLLSYSTGTSGAGPDVDLVAEATALAQEKAPDLSLDGPLQFDAAVDPTVGRSKAPDSPVAGCASVLVFPDLTAGNMTYKAIQRTAGALAVGPVLQGLNAPVNDLSRGALVEDIVNTVLITAVQAGATP